MNNTVVLGMFDGVHIGHASLFSIARTLKSENAGDIIVYTFSNHPLEVISGIKPELILSKSERKNKILTMGVDKIIMEEFNVDICNTTAESFAKDLSRRFNAVNVVVGFNYSFGKAGSGTPEALKAYGEKYGFNVHIAEPVMYKNRPVSSTRIRQAIGKGNISEANAMLGDNFTMSGIVERCRQVGRTMGFPTANIRNPDRKPLPLFGVYATYAHVGDRVLPSITNVGNNPTFGDMAVSIETHIFDFDEDIYDRHITVEFLDFIRPQRKFSGASELKAQITADSMKARSITFSQAN